MALLLPLIQFWLFISLKVHKMWFYIADVYFDHTSMQLAANYFDFPLSHPVPPDSTGFHWIPAGTGVIVT